MKPNAAQYRRLLTEILATIDQSDPSYRERQILISCTLTMADAIEKIERTLQNTVGPALATLLESAKASAPATAPEAPQAPETVEGDETPLATATIAAAQPATNVSGATPTAPVGNGAHLKSGGTLVTTSAPTPIGKAAQT